MAIEDLLAPNDTMGSMATPTNNDTQGHEDLAVYKAVTDSENFGADPIKAYSEGMAMPPEQVFAELGAKYKQVTYNDLNQLIKDTYTNEPEHLVSDFESAKTIHGQVAADAAGPTGPEKYLVSTLNRGTDNDELAQRLANQAYFSRRIRSLVDEQDWKKWLVNFAGTMAINDVSLDISKVSKGSADESAWKSYFSSAENWSKFISAWHAMPPAQQRHDFDILTGLITKATDNNQQKTVEYLTQLLDPTAQPSVQMGQTLDKGFVALDVATVALGAGPLAHALVGSLAAPVKLAKLAKKLDNLDAAAKFMEGAIVDGNIAKAVGTSQTEAITSALPLKADAFMEGAPEDLAQKLKVNFEALDEYNSTDSIRRFGLDLTPEQKASAVQKKVKELEATPDVSSVTVGKVTDEGFDLTYTTKSLDGSVAPETKTHFFTRDDIDSGFSSSETGIGASAFRFFASPNAVAGKGDRRALVNLFESIQLEQEVARKRFAESFKQIFQGLNGDSIKKLNMVMAKGRDTEKYYKYSELVPTGILTEKEFTAYANTMKMMDKAFMFKNKEMRDLAKAQGLKEVSLGENIKELMKPYDTKESAVAALAQSGEKTAFMPEPLKGSLREMELTPQVISDFYDRGYRLVSKAKDKYIKGYDDAYYQFALVKGENVRELPQVILKRREAGYMPVEYKNGLYFVKQVVKGKVGGVERAVDTKTLRYFDNKQDAEKFAEQLITNKDVAASDVRVLHNRELTRDEFGDELVGMHGGLYTGSRGSDELLFGLDGTKGPKVDPMASMSKYFSNIAQRYPMSQYRLAIQQKWMNEARKNWGLPPKFDGSFEQALKFIGSNKDLSITEKTKAIKSHEQISFQMRVPTQSEREVQTWMRTVAEKIETLPIPGNRKLALAIHRFDHADPPASVRASAFNLTMGWYNPAPFLVQAFGSTVAMTIDPLNAPKHLRGAFALQALDNMHNPHALDINAKMIGGKLADADIPDIKKAWDMSGLKESAMFGHADFQAMEKGLPIDRGALRNMWDNQTYFYKQGELFNYRYSFSAAFDWWKRQPGNKKRVIDAKAVDEIVARTNTYLLHMSRANRSSAQKGLAAIPTQFTKIFTQFYEAMVGKELTLKEKVSLLVGQGVLFGYAGVEPIGKVVDWAISKSGGDPQDPSPAAVAARRGLLQTALQEWLGVDVNIANRGAVAGGFYQAVKEALFERKLVEVAAGAAGGITGQRAYETIRQLWNLGAVTDEAPAGSELSTRTWVGAVDAMLSMSSHWRAQTLAYEMYHNKLFRDPRGNLIMHKDDIDVLDYVAIAAGYQPAELQAIYLAQENSRSEQERYADKATSFITTVRKLVDIDGGGYSPEESANVQIVWNALLGSETPAAQDKIRGIVLERLTKPTSREEELVAKRVDDLIQGTVRTDMVSDELIPNYKKKEGIQ